MRLWINDDVLENGLPSEAVTDHINKALLSNSGQTVTTLMRFGIRRDLQYQVDYFFLGNVFHIPKYRWILLSYVLLYIFLCRSGY